MGIQERKKREKERRRQQIMVAAKRVFTAKGLNSSTMEDIAKEAELSPGTIYLYFKNKDELYASLSLRILQYLNLRLKQIEAEKELSSEEKLDALKKVMYDVYEFDPSMLINMFHLQSSETLKNLSPELIDTIKDLSGKSLRMIAGIFQNGIDDGLLLEHHPHAMADIFWSMFSGIVLWEESKKIIDDNKDFLKETLEIAFDIFSKGISRDSELNPALR